MFFKKEKLKKEGFKYFKVSWLSQVMCFQGIIFGIDPHWAMGHVISNCWFLEHSVARTLLDKITTEKKIQTTHKWWGDYCATREMAWDALEASEEEAPCILEDQWGFPWQTESLEESKRAGCGGGKGIAGGWAEGRNPACLGKQSSCPPASPKYPAPPGSCCFLKQFASELADIGNQCWQVALASDTSKSCLRISSSQKVVTRWLVWTDCSQWLFIQVVEM